MTQKHKEIFDKHGGDGGDRVILYEAESVSCGS